MNEGNKPKLFGIVSHSIIGDTLRIVLGYEYKVTMVVSEELARFSLTEEQQTALHENNNTRIILAGFREDVVGQFLWQNLRLVYRLLNPVLVCGYESKMSFTEKHYEFASGASMYHQYLEMPWQRNMLVSLLENLSQPLLNYQHLEGLYRQYGEENLRERLPFILHGLKGKKAAKVLPLAEHVLLLCEALGDPDILTRIKRLVSELRRGETDKLELQRIEIKQLIQGERNG